MWVLKSTHVVITFCKQLSSFSLFYFLLWSKTLGNLNWGMNNEREKFKNWSIYYFAAFKSAWQNWTSMLSAIYWLTQHQYFTNIIWTITNQTERMMLSSWHFQFADLASTDNECCQLITALRSNRHDEIDRPCCRLSIYRLTPHQ